MGDEIGEVGALGQMAGEGRRSVEGDHHRPGLQLRLDPGGDLADLRVGNRQNDDFGAVERRLGRDAVDAEAVLQPLPAGLADLDMADCEARALRDYSPGGSPSFRRRRTKRSPSWRALSQNRSRTIYNWYDSQSAMMASCRRTEREGLERIEADYLVETADRPAPRRPRSMAGEQSSGTFVAVPGETPELKARVGGAGRGLEVLGEARGAVAARRGRAAGRASGAPVTLSWPLDNLGPSLPNLLATVAGNLFELQQFSGLSCSTSACRRRSPTPIRARSSASRARAASPASRAGR